MTSADHKKIHIVDDDPSTIQVLTYVLTKGGYQVNASTSGEEVLGSVRENIPDLILLDIIMPDLDGYSVCTLMKSHPHLSEVPVIFITSSNNTEELVKGFEAGAVDFITKPVNKAELLARVNTHLELKEARDIIARKNEALKAEVKNRRQAEEKFKALSETTFEAVLFLDQYKVIEANKAAFELLGIDLEKDNGFSVDKLVDKKGKQLLSKIFKNKLKKGPWEMTLQNGQGEDFFGQVQYQPLKYKGRNVNVLAIRDITRQKQIDKEILQAILHAEEKERKRFSRDMHDGLGALLSTMKIYTNLLQKDNKDEQEKQMLLNELKDTITKAVESARTIANNIMPSVLMDHGLVKAMKAFVDALEKTGVIAVDFKYSHDHFAVNSNTEIHLYRIALELINNTLKHAEADKIRLELVQDDNILIMNYQDNGKGFDYQKVYGHKKQGQGIKNIMSRVNFLSAGGEFNTQTGKGLSFFMKVPL